MSDGLKYKAFAILIMVLCHPKPLYLLTSYIFEKFEVIRYDDQFISLPDTFTLSLTSLPTPLSEDKGFLFLVHASSIHASTSSSVPLPLPNVFPESSGFFLHWLLPL